MIFLFDFVPNKSIENCEVEKSDSFNVIVVGKLNIIVNMIEKIKATIRKMRLSSFSEAFKCFGNVVENPFSNTVANVKYDTHSSHPA